MLLASVATAQSADAKSANDLPQPIAAARCQYTREEATCVKAPNAFAASCDPTDGTTVAQAPRRPQFPPRMARPLPYPPRAYPASWTREHSGRRALIGALIGGALGVAIGSKGNESASTMAIFGTVGAGIGAGIGVSVSPLPARYRSRSWRYQDEDTLRSNPARRGPRTGSIASTQSIQ